MMRTLSTKTMISVQLFWLASFCSCTNDLPMAPGAATAGHAAPEIMAAGSPAPTTLGIPPMVGSSTPIVSNTAPASTTSNTSNTSTTVATTSAAAGSGGSKATGSAGSAAASAGKSGSAGSAAASAGAGGDSDADDPFGLGSAASDPGTDPTTSPPAGMCENLFCFDIFDCAIFHLDEAAVCNFTECVDFVCQ